MISKPQSLCELPSLVWEHVSKYLTLQHDLVELLQIDGYDQVRHGCHAFLSRSVVYFALECSETDTKDTVDTLNLADIQCIDQLKDMLTKVRFSSSSFLLNEQTYQLVVKTLTAEDSSVRSVNVCVFARSRHGRTHFFGVSDVNHFNWSRLLQELAAAKIQVSLTITLDYHMYVRHIQSLLACPPTDCRCRYTTGLKVEMNQRYENSRHLHSRPFRWQLPITNIVAKFVNLKSLVLHVLCLEDNLLNKLADTNDREALKSLTITSHEPMAAQKIPLLSEEAWSSLTRACPNLEVGCALDDQVKVPLGAYLTSLFKPVVPVVRMAIDVFNEDNVQALVAFWKRHRKTLTDVMMAVHAKNDSLSGVKACYRNCQSLLHKAFCDTDVLPHVVLEVIGTFMITVTYRR